MLDKVKQQGFESDPDGVQILQRNSMGRQQPYS